MKRPRKTKTERKPKPSLAKQNILQQRSAIVGETFAYKSLFTGETFEVTAKRPGERGQWVCISCGLPFVSQLEKDTHLTSRPSRHRMLLIEKGPRAQHVLAWRNFETAETEVP